MHNVCVLIVSYIILNMRPEVKQVFYGTAPLLILMANGMSLGLTGVLIAAFHKNNELSIKPTEFSWIGALPSIAGFVFIFAIGPLMQIYGRKVTFLSFTIPTIFGWILAALSYDKIVLFISLVLLGSSQGSYFFLSTCVAEYTNPSIREVLLNIKIAGFSLGVLIMHICGYYLHWRQLPFIGLIPLCIAFFISLLWPDSPEWLISENEYDKAAKVFYNLRGHNEESERELNNMIVTEKKRKELCSKSTNNLRKFFTDLKSPVMWRPVCLLILAIALTDIGGRRFMPSYTMLIVEKITGNSARNSVYLISIIIDLVGFLASGLSVIVIRIFQRRKLLFCSGISAGLVLFLSCTFMVLSNAFSQTTSLKWISTALLGIYFFIVLCCTFPVCFVLVGELVPLEFKSIGAVVESVATNIINVGIMFLMPMLKERYDTYGMFYISVCGQTIALIYLYFYLPETKNRTLHDIAEYFRGRGEKYPAVKLTNETKLLSRELNKDEMDV